MKKIIIIWAVISITLVGFLTYIGFAIKKQNEPYKKLEKDLEKTAIALIGEKPSILDDGNIIDMNTFVNNGYNINMTVGTDLCDGYVYVNKVLSIYQYVPYIKCQKYTTNGYKKS